jgi:hypothetical protein
MWEEKQKKKKTHTFSLDFMETKLQKYHLLHSLLPKVLLNIFLGVFFFFLLLRNTWERQIVDLTPPHT